MGNVFDISRIAGQIGSDAINKAKAKAIDLAGLIGLNDLAGGRVLPPLPPYPESLQVHISSANGYTVETIAEELTTPASSIFGVPMCFPLKIKLTNSKDSDWWLLPVEPMITLGGGNTLIRRNVAKSQLRGSIKERWNTDDYAININGLFTKKDNWTYPKSDMIRLLKILEERDTIELECELFEIFSISRMVIEKYDFPFTKGEENQAWNIIGYSDDSWNLFIKLDTK